MSIELYFFYFFIGLTIVPALFILFTKNILYAAFLLLASFLGIGGLYVFAHADFLAVSQIMIYVGGILVLILFGIMLTNRVAGQRYVLSESRNVFIGFVIGVTIFVALFIGIVKTNFSTIVWISGRKGIVNADTTLTQMGENLMTNFILPFEIAAVLLMVALIGSAFIASQIVKKRNN